MPDGPPRELDIEQIQPSPDQPRKHFDEAAMQELTDSIRTHGILQPLVVSPTGRAPGGVKQYRLVAGERRWRAAQRAGVHRVPVVVKDVDDEDRLELALIENIQREDLNPIEEARAYSQLLDLRNYTQDELAMRVGKDRSTISNALRLLRLPDKVQTWVQEGRLSMGHARALLGLAHEDEMTSVAAEVIKGTLSVRDTEAAVRKRAQERKPQKEPSDEEQRRKIIVSELETRLRRRLGVRVRLKTQGSKGAGVLEVPYASLDELDRLLHIIAGNE
jgi:ParB family chromosome partitioning protein